MDGPRDDHIKWSKSDKYHTTYMWNLKKKKKKIQMNLFTNQEQIHKEKKSWLPKG